MSLFEQVNEHIKEAMKAKEKERLEALRMLKAKFIENKTSVRPKEELDIVVSYTKSLRDSLSSFPPGHEIHQKVEQELKYLNVYLPSQLDETQVKELIAQLIEQNPESQMGTVMKELTPKIKGRFDGKRASELVKEMVSK